LLTQSALYAALLLPTSQLLIVALVAAVSAVAAAAGPLGAKYLHAVVDEASRPLAARRNAQIQAMSGVFGTILGGFSFGLVALDWMLLANAVSFLILGSAAVLVGQVAFERGDIDGMPTEVSGVNHGFLLLRSGQVFGTGLAVVLIGVMFGTSLEGVAGPFYLTTDLDLSPGAYGALLGTWSIGILVGSAWTAPTRDAQAGRVSILRFAALMGGCILSVALLDNSFAAIGLYAVGGVANGVINAGVGVVIFSTVRSAEQGRAWAAFGAVANASVLAGYLCGLALQNFDSRWVVAASGLIPLLLSGVALMLQRKKESETLMR